MIACTSCATALPADLLAAGVPMRCPSCRALLLAEVFPAFFRELAKSSPERVESDLEASCFFHSDKRAHAPCDACGRFLCALCDCEVDGRHLCPTCLESGKRLGKLDRLTTERTLYDSIALSLAVLPLLIFYLTLVTAPVVLYFCVRHWKSPTSLLPRTRWRFVVAFAIAVLQLVGWAALIVVVIAAIQKG